MKEETTKEESLLRPKAGYCQHTSPKLNKPQTR